MYALSVREAKRSPDGNWSDYVYAGIPLLLASVHAFSVEYENTLLRNSNLRPIDDLAGVVEQRYGMPGPLLQDIKDLVEIRNELIHPVPLPTGTPDNWPDYLRRIKDLGLLNTTCRPDGDYPLLSQIASHRLFTWAVGIVKQMFRAIVESNPDRAPLFRDLLKNLEAPWFTNGDDDAQLNAILRLV